jgi:hypothetical protein
MRSNLSLSLAVFASLLAATALGGLVSVAYRLELLEFQMGSNGIDPTPERASLAVVDGEDI